jgi:GNAT superfamily N-acetyltransferase
MFAARPATPADTAALVDLLAAQLRDHGLAAAGEQVRRGVETAFAMGATLLVAVEEGGPVGVLLANRIASVEHGGAVLYIEELFVEPSSRRRGIARALIERLISDARSAGVRALELEIDAGHEPARALYRRLGFAPNARAVLSRVL